jgi:hypothetical protein
LVCYQNNCCKNGNSSGTWDVTGVGGLFRFPHQFEPRSLSESGIPSILALIPRCCTEKISVLARWMICAQNNASEIISRQTAGDAGDFSFAAASSLQRGIQPSQGLPGLPNHPFPLPGTFSSLQDSHPSVPAKGLFPSKRNAPQIGAPGRTGKSGT